MGNTKPHPPERPFGVLSCAPDPLHTDLLRNAISSHHDAATLHVGINRFVRVAVCMLVPNWHSTEETYSNARPHQFVLTPQCTTPQHHDYTRSLPNYCQPRVKASCNPQTKLTKSKLRRVSIAPQFEHHRCTATNSRQLCIIIQD
jgi:hypothetical protein